jgi:hypothetical protein
MKRSGVSDARNAVVWSILGYLYAHPDSKDTSVGIRTWWLCGADAGADAVQSALDELLVCGWITLSDTSSSHPMYGLNQTRRAALQQFLDGV